MKKLIYFESERMIFRRWQEKDHDFFIRLNQDSQVRKYFDGVLTPEESISFLNRTEKSIEELGFGYWCVEEKLNKQPIGALGFSLVDFDAPFTPCLEIGWRFHPDFGGQGYASEGGRTALDYIFSNTDHRVVFSFTSPLNVPSEAVMRRIGMTKCGYFSHPKVPDGHRLKEHVYYKIEKYENI